MKKYHFKVTVYATNIEPEKEVFFKNAKECQEFLKIKSYSILYNIMKNHTKYAHNKNKHLKDTFKVERINKELTLTKKKEKLLNDELKEMHRKEFKESLHSLSHLL